MAIVTDSAATFVDEPPAQVRIVPLRILLAERDLPDERGISLEGVLAEVSGGRRLTTSRPSPGQFGELFDQCANEGFTEILALSISGELSGTHAAALLAAQTSRIPVYCCDSRSLGLGQGLLVEEAARAALAGWSGDLLLARIREMAARGRGAFVFRRDA
ncbi:MAG: DegV family protein, partial [Angustibacter sp.]